MLCRVPDNVSKGIRKELEDALARLAESGKGSHISGK